MEVGRTGQCRRCRGGRGAGSPRPTPSQLLLRGGHSLPSSPTTRRGGRRRRLGDGVEAVRAGKTFELDVAALVECNAGSIADGIAHDLTDQNLTALGLPGHPCRHCDVAAEQIVATPYRLSHVDANPNPNA